MRPVNRKGHAGQKRDSMSHHPEALLLPAQLSRLLIKLRAVRGGPGDAVAQAQRCADRHGLEKIEAEGVVIPGELVVDERILRRIGDGIIEGEKSAEVK